MSLKDFAYEQNKVFVGMQFDTTTDEIYEVIKKACIDNGLEPNRVDELVGASSIINDIERLIEEAEFIILDLTYSNANVYYELGYAFGSENRESDILLLAKDGTDLKYDVRHRRVLFYKDAYDLQKKLNEKLPKFIEEGRK